jgi:hypothetical protein
MEPVDPEKLKARRVQIILYLLMAVMIGFPVLAFCFRHI